MNILYIDHYAGSLSMGMEFRPYYLAREWEKKGHKVRVLGANFSHLRRINPTVSKDFEIQRIEDVEFQWVKTGTYEGNGIPRALTMMQFCAKLYFNAKKIIKQFKPDVVITSSTYPLDTYPAQRIAKLAGAVLIHEAHDVWPLTLVELGGMSRRNPFVVLLNYAEKSAYKNSDKIVSVLPNTLEHMQEQGLKNPDKFTYICNGIVVDDWNNRDALDGETNHVFAKLKEQNKFIVCYLGGHALSNALDTLVESAELVKDDESIAFVLIGKGVEKERLVAFANEKEIKNIFFLPPVNKTQVPSVLDMADAFYIGAAPCPLYRFGVSMNKVYDYMMAGKPIIYGVKAANNEVEEAQCGITIEPENKVAIVDAVMKLKNCNPEERRRLGENGKRWVLENCEYSVLADRFLALMTVK